MDFPTPITEEPPTPILGELARRYVPFQQQDRDPYPARMLHSVPDYFNFTSNLNDSDERISLLPTTEPTGNESPCSSGCQHNKKPTKPFNKYIDVISIVFIVAVGGFLFWVFLVQNINVPVP